MIVKDQDRNIEKEVPKSKQEEQKLSDSQILVLSKLCQRIEEHYNHPQDIEWAIENGKFWRWYSKRWFFNYLRRIG